jgi:hypothetical protein
MHDRKLTDKEWEILLYFISNEGCGPEGDGHEGYAPFLAYPAKIERDLGKGVTRSWAAKICADFESLGILGHQMIKPPRQKHETEHYFLKSDLTTLRSVVSLIVGHAKPEDRYWLMSFRYFRRSTGEALVRKVLYEKGVEMWRTIGLPYWNDKDARQLYSAYVEREKKGDRMDATVYDVPLEEYVRRLLRGDTEGDDGYWTSAEISLRLPVFPDSVPKEEQSASFHLLNKKELEQYPFILYNSSGIESHYRRWQYEKLVLPILVLVQISPSALAEFLCGDWKPYGSETPSFKPEGTAMMEHTLFRLLFMAIGDLARTRSIAGEGIARMAWLRKSNNMISDTDQDALFTVSLSNCRNIYYDGGFDTVHDFYGSEKEYEPDNELDYWVKTWVDFDNDMSRGLLLQRESNADLEKLAIRLRDRDFLAAHLRSRLSYEVQRLLMLAGPEDLRSERLQSALLAGLNEMIMGECIYNEMAFKNIRLSEDTRKMLDNNRRSEADSPSIDTFVLNRALLIDALPGVLRP